MEISEKITASEMYENTRFNIELEKERAKKKKRDSDRMALVRAEWELKRSAEKEAYEQSQKEIEAANET